MTCGIRLKVGLRRVSQTCVTCRVGLAGFCCIFSYLAEVWRPHGDSNPGLRRERAPSWASRRWGPTRRGNRPARGRTRYRSPPRGASVFPRHAEISRDSPAAWPCPSALRPGAGRPRPSGYSAVAFTPDFVSRDACNGVLAGYSARLQPAPRRLVVPGAFVWGVAGSAGHTGYTGAERA
jgi:hypothetical protein